MGVVRAWSAVLDEVKLDSKMPYYEFCDNSYSSLRYSGVGTTTQRRPQILKKIEF